MAKRFSNEICVRMEPGNDADPAFPLIVGTPDHISQMDADDGDHVAIYRLVGVKRFRTYHRLDSK